jgi:hypothetical protein
MRLIVTAGVIAFTKVHENVVTENLTNQNAEQGFAWVQV